MRAPWSKGFGAQEVRKIEPYLKLLASRKLGLSRILPPHPERSAILETLVRDKLAEPAMHPHLGEEEVLSTVRAHLGA